MAEEENKKSRNKYKLMSTIVIICTIVLISLLIYYFVSKNNANSQIEELKNNISQNNYSDLAKQLSTNQREMKPSEAKHLTNYFKKDANKTRLNKDIQQIEDNIANKSSMSDLGAITDNKGKAIINFSKNGKQFFILDKISMEPQYRKVYIKESDNDATYNFDKKHQVAVEKNKLNEVGSFVVGNYDVPVKKEFKSGPVKGSVDGYIHINTNKTQDNKHIIAKQDFNQTKIKIKLHNDSKLKDKKLYINNELTNLVENKEYGYFPNGNSFDVNVSGKLNNDTFKTNTVSVTKGIDDNTQVVNLNFNEEEINEKLKANKETRKDITEFIKKYMDHLNEAYDKTTYTPIQKDIKTGSEAEKFMKPKFDAKQKIKYNSTKVKDIEKQGNKYKVSVNKKYKSNLVKTIYYVEKDEDDFEIIKMEDKT